jgi:hypothetical protein
MPLFRRGFKRFDDQAAKVKKKKLKNQKKKRQMSGILSKLSQPLVAFEDSSGVSPKNSLSRWEELKQEKEEDNFGVLQASTKENKQTSGFIVDSQIKKGMHKDENNPWKTSENYSRLFRKTKKYQVKTKPARLNKDKAIKSKPVLADHGEKQLERAEKYIGENEKKDRKEENKAASPPDKSAMIENIMKPQLSEFGDASKKQEESPEDETSFPDREPEDPLECFMVKDKIEPREPKKEHESLMTLKKLDEDERTFELTYSQSRSESDTEPTHSGVENLVVVKDEPDKEVLVDPPSRTIIDNTTKENTVPVSDAIFDNATEVLSDINPSADVSGYVSLNHMQKNSHSERSLESSMRQVGSDEEVEEAKWLAKSNMATPLGATIQEIVSLNQFLSVVGPDFNGRNVSYADRKEIYDSARKVGMNKVMVNKLLDQSAGVATVELASTYSDLSTGSTYSTSTTSMRLTKSASSDHTCTTGYTKESENISYYNLPRTSPQTDINYGCTDTFKNHFWTESKKTGQDILESLGAVVIGDNESVHLEA